MVHKRPAINYLWTTSEMVKYKGNTLLKIPKSGPVFHHLWHSPCWFLQAKIFLTLYPRLKYPQPVLPMMQLIWQSRQQALRAYSYCHNVYTVMEGLFGCWCAKDGSSYLQPNYGFSFFISCFAQKSQKSSRKISCISSNSHNLHVKVPRKYLHDINYASTTYRSPTT